MPEEYYRQRLTKAQQQTYHAVKTGLLSLAASFPVPTADMAELSEIFTFVRLDCPEIFYAPSFSCRYRQGAESMELVPDYLFKKKQTEEHRRALEARVNRLCAAAGGLDEQGREQYIHDFICKNVRYDKLKKPYSHEVIGPLTQGVGVCEGIAKSVKLLCDRLNIPCVVAFSENNPEKGVKYRHAWNVVRVGGKTYHLDATFDLSLSEGERLRYDYFNLGDESLFRDHERLVWPVPACTDDSHSWYITQKLAFTKKENLRSRLGQTAKKGRSLTFRWRGGYLTREVLSELLSIAAEEGERVGKNAAVSLNWPQAVLTVSYTADRPAEAVTMEDANEGEREE